MLSFFRLLPHPNNTGIQDCFHVTNYFIISLNGVVFIDRISGARYCISQPVIWCSSYDGIVKSMGTLNQAVRGQVCQDGMGKSVHVAAAP